MCGIGGIFRRDGEPIPDEWLDAIDRRIAHRGPDGAGVFRDRIEVNAGDPDEGSDGPRRSGRALEVALVHRRLAIIDPETGGQPMVSEIGRTEAEGLIAVVFNGCIYNHRELRLELERAGHTFTTDHSDTEVLIHGYREWDTGLQNRLEGMYAFALWDRTNGRLLLSRDLFGEKPLWVRWSVDDNPNILAFASDAKALDDLAPTMPARTPADVPYADRHWLPRYLQLGYHWQKSTPFDDLVLEPPHAVEPTIVTSIDEFLPMKQREMSTQVEFEIALRRAVQRRLEADVPLGCFLSGGVDSSLIAHLAHEAIGDLHTFAVRMPDPRYDESDIAERIADHLGTTHTTLDVAMDPARDLVHLVRTLGLPFGDSSILPTYWVSRAARKHVKVALSGDGGDELFIGYERYLGARHVDRHQRALKWIPERIMRNAHPKSKRYLIGRLGQMARDMRRIGTLGIESIFFQDQITELLGVRPVAPARSAERSDPMQSLRRADCINYLPNDLLLKVDTASMAVGLEVRCPFLDRDLARLVLAAPTHQLVPKGQRKGLLRDIARKYLPADIVDRPKRGFAIPIGTWFRDDTGGMRTMLNERLRVSRPFGPFELRHAAVERFIDEHHAGTFDHSQRLFVLLTLAIWAQDVL
jgi:asparagine synthase (glutamine-hydrolysing)